MKMKHPKTEDQSDDFQGGFVAGLFYQAMCEGVIDIKHSVEPEYVEFILAFAADNDYETQTVELEDGLVDVLLHRVG